jgi:hypothetical protein
VGDDVEIRVGQYDAMMMMMMMMMECEYTRVPGGRTSDDRSGHRHMYMDVNEHIRGNEHYEDQTERITMT